MFYRASSNTSGTGLGLYICREIITKLGGSIELSSIVGKGSVFIIELPNNKEFADKDLNSLKNLTLSF